MIVFSLKSSFPWSLITYLLERRRQYQTIFQWHFVIVFIYQYLQDSFVNVK